MLIAIDIDFITDANSSRRRGGSMSIKFIPKFYRLTACFKCMCAAECIIL